MATQPRQRILIFLPFLTYGGAERQGFLLARGLHNTPGLQVEVCGFKFPSGQYPLAADLEKEGIPHFTLPFGMEVMPGRKTLLKALITFARLVRQKKFDVVIPFTFWPNYLTGLSARFIPARCFWNQRSVDDHVPVRRMEKLLPLGKIQFISNSNPGRHFLHRRLGINEDKIALIPNSVVPLNAKNTPAFWQQHLGLQGQVVITMVANLFPEKDFDTVLHAAALLKSKGFNYRFLFAGGNSHMHRLNALKAIAYDNDLGNTVSFLSNINDVGGLLQVTDIGLLSSISEGCPNSILEYMQSGLPVVANNIEAISDVLGSGYPYLFETGNAEDLALKLQQLGENPGLRLQTGTALKEMVEARYVHTRMIDAYLQLLSKG